MIFRKLKKRIAANIYIARSFARVTIACAAAFTALNAYVWSKVMIRGNQIISDTEPLPEYIKLVIIPFSFLCLSIFAPSLLAYKGRGLYALASSVAIFITYLIWVFHVVSGLFLVSTSVYDMPRF